MNIKTIALSAVMVAAFVCSATRSEATLVTASGIGPDGQAISASADFVNLGGNQLRVTLANTFTGTTFGIAETLYGVFFNGATGLTLVSATAPTGTKMWDLTGPTGSSVTLASPTAISDWHTATFSGLAGASALGTGNQSSGLLSQGFNGTITDGLGNSNHNPYFQNSLVLLFSYTSLGDITNVKFQYGTAGATYISDGPPTVPEPSTIAAGALLLLPFGASALKIMRKKG